MSLIKRPEILIPKSDLEKWSVVACDQFTSEPEYWKTLEQFVGDAPSALKIIFPEVYMGDDDDARIASVNAEMRRYLDEGLFDEKEGFVLIERTFDDGAQRVGLLLCVDLEEYDWNRVPVRIRATEDTLKERLPVRVKIRKDAPLELPHILLMIDDERREIVETLYRNRDKLPLLYDFGLNMKGGRLKGYLVEDSSETERLILALGDRERQIAKYGADEKIVFAVGDGNHSLASAKVHWENLKPSLTEEEKQSHPARYALVEVVNVYSDGITFEPIHRVLFGADEEKIKALLAEKLGRDNLTEPGDRLIRYDGGLGAGETIEAVEKAVTELKKEGVKVDYVHDVPRLKEVAKKLNGVGIAMPEFPKNELFPYVLKVGNLPKKAFSIGKAEEKKYYVESRKIR